MEPGRLNLSHLITPRLLRRPLPKGAVELNRWRLAPGPRAESVCGDAKTLYIP